MALQQLQYFENIKKVVQSFCIQSSYISDKFYLRTSVIRLRLGLSSIPRTILSGDYVCFSLQRSIWTAFSLSLVRAVSYKVHKAHSLRAVSPPEFLPCHLVSFVLSNLEILWLCFHNSLCYQNNSTVLTNSILIKANCKFRLNKNKIWFFSYTTLRKSITLLHVRSAFLYSSKIHNNLIHPF